MLRKELEVISDSIVVVEAVSVAVSVSWLRSREDEASIAAGWDDSHGVPWHVLGTLCLPRSVLGLNSALVSRARVH